MANEYRPTDVYLKHMVIGSNEAMAGNFHVKELRVYEDICKYYLTGQLVIEVMQNAMNTRPNRYTILNDTDLSSNNLSLIFNKIYN